jgi:hypothetical protein
MQRLVYVCLCVFLCSFTIDRVKLRNMLNRPAPAWMDKHIQEDLGHFQKADVTKEAIDKTIQDVYSLPGGNGAQFVRYQIINNKLHWSSATESATDPRISHFVSFFERMLDVVRIPDVDFLVSIWDSYDRPLYLEKTHCPIFAISKMKTNHKTVLFPEVRNFDYREGVFKHVQSMTSQFPWEKKIEIAFWRGMTSGSYYPWYEWDFKPRPRLILFSKEHPDLLDAGFTSPYYLDEELKKWFEKYDYFRPFIYNQDQLAYKYLIAIDGNTFPSSVDWQLLSNSVMIKNESQFLEWYYEALEPYVHFVPFKQDLSDLEEKINWVKQNDRKARQIAETATRFALDNLSNEAVILYFYKLLHAYAALQKS